jgi:hypothetical protein
MNGDNVAKVLPANLARAILELYDYVNPLLHIGARGETREVEGKLRSVSCLGLSDSGDRNITWAY